MPQYKTCPLCGAHLDHGEKCDCQDKKREAAPLQRERPQGNTFKVSLTEPRPEVKQPLRGNRR